MILINVLIFCLNIKILNWSKIKIAYNP